MVVCEFHRIRKNIILSYETSINAGFTKDHENLVCEFHVTFNNQIIYT